MSEPAIWIIAAEWCVRIGFSIRVVLRRQDIGTSLAWLTIILLVPFVGAGVYVLLGEKRLGYYRAERAARFAKQHESWRNSLRKHEYADWESRSDPSQLSRLITHYVHIPALAGNNLQLLDSANSIFCAMVDDIRQARDSCYLEYYIWEVGGLADDVAHALSAAVKRGVDCRILVDAVGSRGFLRSQQARELQNDGVQIQAALPANLFRALFYRFDLRLHRKIAIFDGTIAYVGSQNMADPKRFQQGAGFGQWIDAMVRIQGPAVDPLSMLFLEDWNFESPAAVPPSENAFQLGQSDTPGTVPIQVIPSGPGMSSRAIRQTLINAIYMADRKLCLTTPYFVPDELLQTALLSAVHRGVDVTILIPEKVNSRLVEIASRPFIRELIEAGVTVARHRSGMLHTKSVVVDHDTSMFGSLNLTPRSLNLNLEITLVVFDPEFIDSLAALQNRYLADSRILVIGDIPIGSLHTRLIENCVRLMSPLL